MKRSDALATLSSVLFATSLPRPGATAEPLRIRVAYAAVELSSAFYAGLEAGFFQKAGLVVEAQPMSTGSAMSAAVVAGSVDVGDVNVLSMAEGYEKGVPLTYIALDGLYSSSEPADGLVVNGGAGITSAQQLNNKTVAINVLNGIAYLGVRAWIDQNGGDSASVHFVEMPFSVMPDALAAKRVDAILVSEPELRHSRENGGRVLSFPYNAIAPHFMVAGWVASAPWVNNNIETAKRFHAAMQTAEIWANHNRALTAKYVEKYTKVDAKTVQSMSRATFPERSDVTLAQPVIDVAIKYGFLKKAIHASDLFSRAVLG